jgi:predicted lactoylglutathione lyase
MLKQVRYLFLFGILIFGMACSSNQDKNQKSMEQQKEKNGGIVFYATKQLDRISEFYMDKVGCELWLDQGACKILKHGNMLVGFCKSDHVDKESVITFFYPRKERVDEMYQKLETIAKEKPKMNPKFNIYHFYAQDPEGRSIEFQYFDHELRDF